MSAWSLPGRLRGRPRPWRTLGTASRAGASIMLSCRLAGLRRTPSGVPRRSTTRWRFVPGFPRSVGFGPVSAPPFSRQLRRYQGTLGSSPVVPHPRGAPEERGEAWSRHRLSASHAACGLQVMPEPNSRGSISQGILERRMKMMPAKASRPLHQGQPAFGFGRFLGRSGAMFSHRSSDTRGLLMASQRMNSRFVRRFQCAIISCATSSPVKADG